MGRRARTNGVAVAAELGVPPRHRVALRANLRRGCAGGETDGRVRKTSTRSWMRRTRVAPSSRAPPRAPRGRAHPPPRRIHLAETSPRGPRRRGGEKPPRPRATYRVNQDPNHGVWSSYGKSVASELTESSRIVQQPRTLLVAVRSSPSPARPRTTSTHTSVHRCTHSTRETNRRALRREPSVPRASVPHPRLVSRVTRPSGANLHSRRRASILFRLFSILSSTRRSRRARPSSRRRRPRRRRRRACPFAILLLAAPAAPAPAASTVRHASRRALDVRAVGTGDVDGFRAVIVALLDVKLNGFILRVRGGWDGDGSGRGRRRVERDD